MSIIKNILTLGSYGKLQDEEFDLQTLASKFSALQNKYIEIGQSHLNALRFLKNEREDVTKNLSLAKNLLSKINTISSKKEQVIKKDFVSYIDNKSIEFQIEDISIDFQGKLDQVSETFLISLGDSFNNLGDKKTFTRSDLKLAFTEIAFDVILEGIDTIIALNGEVKDKRANVKATLRQITSAIGEISKRVPTIHLETKRMIEIAKVLNMHNQVFSNKYSTIQKEISRAPKVSIFIKELFNKMIVPDDKMIEDINMLRKFSSEYNAFNSNSHVK